MIPPEWRLRPPDGVSDEITRQLLLLTEERLGGLPLERVLTWAIEHQDPIVLGHLATALGLDRLTWLAVDSAELLSQGIAFARQLGTPGAVEKALAALGHTAWCHERTRLFCDGSIKADGTFVAGADRHWAMFWIVVAAAELTPEQQAQIAATVEVAGRRSAELRRVYLVDDPDDFGDVSTYRAHRSLYLPTDTLFAATGEDVISDGSLQWLSRTGHVAVSGGNDPALDPTGGPAGKACLSKTGTQHLRCDSLIPHIGGTNAPFSLFLVNKSAATTATSFIAFASISSAANNIAWQFYSRRDLATFILRKRGPADAGNVDAVRGTSGAWAADAWVTFGVVYDGSEARFFVANQQIGAAIAWQSQPIDPESLQCRLLSSQLVGGGSQTASMLICKGAISDSDRDAWYASIRSYYLGQVD